MVVLQKMYHCSSCDVYVGTGLFDGEIVVVTGDAFRALLDRYHRTQNRYIAEVYDPLTWMENAQDENDQSVWFEHEEIEQLWWYKARGLKELHDHPLWMTLVKSVEEVSMDESALSLLEQQSPFFMDYLKQFPDLERQVKSDAELAFSTFAQSGCIDFTVDELVAARDAAFRLCGVADGAGFGDIGSFFYVCYELLCGQLSRYQG